MNRGTSNVDNNLIGCQQFQTAGTEYRRPGWPAGCPKQVIAAQHRALVSREALEGSEQHTEEKEPALLEPSVPSSESQRYE